MNLHDYTFIITGLDHGNPLGLARTLGENGIAPIGILLRGDVASASKSRYWKAVHMVDSVKEIYELLIDKYAVEDKKAFLFSADDGITRFLNEHYEQMKKYFYFNSALMGRLPEYMDKNNIMRLAEEHGLKTAKYWEVKRGEIPDDIEYPVITKASQSYTGDWKANMVICHNAEELKKAYEDAITCPRVIVQRYVEKKNELPLEGISVLAGRQCAIAIAVSFLFQPENKYGRYMRIGPSTDKELERKIFAMLEEIGYEGLFEAEFLVGKDDELYFLEINFRSSIWNYAATIAGIPLPLVWAQAMLEPEKLRELCDVQVKSFTAMDELDDFRDRVMTRKITFGHWLSELHGCKCKYYIGRNDRKPFVFMFFTSVRRKVKKMIRK